MRAVCLFVSSSACFCQASDAGSSVIVAAGRIPSRVDYDYLLNQASHDCGSW